MNCRNFETIITDLARERVMDAATLESGLSHAETCARCAARLADERTLTAGLRAVSASLATAEASARLEAKLLVAFRECAAAPSSSPVIFPAAVGTQRRWHWSIGALAAAAAILLVIGLNAFRLQHTQSTDEPLAARDPATPVTATPRREQSPEIYMQRTGSSATAPISSERHATLAASSQNTPRYAPASVKRTRRVDAGSSVNERDGVDAASVSDTEIMTDFMPLTYEGGLTPLESGHVVRVELPRTALVSMGLPMNVERAGELVKADVVLGDDGVARAIRFVR